MRNFFPTLKGISSFRKNQNRPKKILKEFFLQFLLKTEFSWAGIFGTTKDGLLYIGSYRNLTNSFFALGFGGDGITFSQVAGEIIASLIGGKKNKDANIFSFER